MSQHFPGDPLALTWQVFRRRRALFDAAAQPD